MTDRHKANPVTFRPSPDDRAWLYRQAQTEGRSVGSLLTEALAEYRAAREKAS